MTSITMTGSTFVSLFQDLHLAAGKDKHAPLLGMARIASSALDGVTYATTTTTNRFIVAQRTLPAIAATEGVLLANAAEMHTIARALVKLPDVEVTLERVSLDQVRVSYAGTVTLVDSTVADFPRVSQLLTSCRERSASGPRLVGSVMAVNPAFLAALGKMAGRNVPILITPSGDDTKPWLVRAGITAALIMPVRTAASHPDLTPASFLDDLMIGAPE